MQINESDKKKASFDSLEKLQNISVNILEKICNAIIKENPEILYGKNLSQILNHSIILLYRIYLFHFIDRFDNVSSKKKENFTTIPENSEDKIHENRNEIWDQLSQKYEFFTHHKLNNKDFNQILYFIGSKFTQENLHSQNLQIESYGRLLEYLLNCELDIQEDASFDLSLKYTKRKNKKKGVFFTPEPIIEYMCEIALNSFLENQITEKKSANLLNYLLNLKILDPAMGTGLFLLSITEKLTEYVIKEIDNELLQTRFENELDLAPLKSLSGIIFSHIARNCIYGVDVNPLSVEITRMIFRKECINVSSNLDFTSQHFKCGNSLIGDLDYQSINQSNDKTLNLAENGFDWSKEFSEIISKKEGFDIILSNPPYISYGLGRVGKIPKLIDTYFRENYPNSAEYKISIYALFIELGITLLKEGGVLCYLLPDSYLTGRYFSKIRKYLLKWKIMKFVFMKENFWKKAEVGFPTILLVKKDTNNAAHRIDYFYSEDLADLARSLDYLRVRQAEFRTNKHSRFRFIPDNTTLKIIEKIEAKSSNKLGDYLEFHHGVRSKKGIGRSQIVNREKRCIQWKQALVSGSAIKQFYIQKSEHFIHIDPNLLYSGGWDKTHIHPPKILVRRTGDNIIAALDLDSHYHTNALIYATPTQTALKIWGLKRTDPQIIPILKIFTAILNSSLFQFYYEAVSMKKHRVLPQVEIDMLNEMKIPEYLSTFTKIERSGFFDDWADEQALYAWCKSSKMHAILSKICTLVDQITKVRDGHPENLNSANFSPLSQEKILNYKSIIDKIIAFSLYDLNPSETHHISNNVNPLIY